MKKVKDPRALMSTMTTLRRTFKEPYRRLTYRYPYGTYWFRVLPPLPQSQVDSPFLYFQAYSWANCPTLVDPTSVDPDRNMNAVKKTRRLCSCKPSRTTLLFRAQP